MYAIYLGLVAEGLRAVSMGLLHFVCKSARLRGMHAWPSVLQRRVEVVPIAL